ncbi:uncharacterized protein LOC126092775 [Schistocerca cancellata]|uniref:uncharacterized protein LOC126092775 n=1 Tax=Schistocerca cancellata TaxID=274614 RepID=UPI0021174B87|nr:uncharacterized protein LOC126092775 [Schistocerca cancellata]
MDSSGKKERCSPSVKKERAYEAKADRSFQQGRGDGPRGAGGSTDIGWLAPAVSRPLRTYNGGAFPAVLRWPSQRSLFIMRDKMVDLEALIALVYERPAIWDRESRNHSKRHVVEKCWAEISSEMKTDETVIRKKWKYLRDQFAVELGRKPASRWPYLHLLMFLEDFVKVRKPGKVRRVLLSESTESAASTSDELPTEVCKTCRTDAEPCDLKMLASSPQSVSDVSLEAEETCSSNKPLLLSSTQLSPREKKGKNRQLKHYNKSVLETEKQKLKYSLAKSHKKSHTDDLDDDGDDCDELFLKSLMIHIKKIPDCKKLLFRNRINEVVQEFAYPNQPTSHITE